MSYALTYYFTGTTTFHLSYSLTFIHPSPIHPYPFSFFSPSLLSILHFYSLTDRCNGSILLLFLPSILHFYPSILILFSLLPILHFFLLLILLLILFSLLPSPLLYGSFASIHPSILSLSFAFFTIRQRQRQRQRQRILLLILFSLLPSPYPFFFTSYPYPLLSNPSRLGNGLIYCWQVGGGATATINNNGIDKRQRVGNDNR